MPSTKQLKLLLVVVLGLLILLLIVNARKYSEIQKNSQKEKKITENITEVVNNGGEVVTYNGYLYYIAKKEKENGFENWLCRRNLETDQEELLDNLESYQAIRKILIYGNRLFFSVLNTTYVKDLSKIEYSTSFCGGVLDDIRNGNAIYSYQHNVFLSTYFLDTFQLRGDVSRLILGDTVWIGTDDKGVYYYSSDQEDKSQVIAFYFDKNDAEVVGEFSKDGYQVVKAMISPHNLMMLLENENQTKIVKMEKNSGKTEETIFPQKIIASNLKKDDFYFVGKDLKNYHLENQSYKMLEKSVPSKTGNMYALLQEDKQVVLYKNGQKVVVLTSLEEGNIDAVSIEEVASQVFIRFHVVNSQKEIIKENMFFRYRGEKNQIDNLNKKS